MTIDCAKCGQTQVINCTDEEYIDWKENHRLIQNAMPNTPKEERELLISGYCNSCFQRLFAEEP